MRKSLKRFAAILCAAVTIVSFSGTKVEAADGDGDWTTFLVRSYWYNRYNPQKQYVSNRIEKYGGPGFNPRAKVEFNFSDYEIYKYEAEVRFVYSVETGKKRIDRMTKRDYNLNPGTYEFDYSLSGSKYYFAIEPVFRVTMNTQDVTVEREGDILFYWYRGEHVE